MATCRDIVTRSLRRLGVLASGEAVQASEMADGITALQEKIDALRYSSFGELQVVNTDKSITAEAMTRIMGTSLTGISVTLPSENEDGTPLYDGAVIEIRDQHSTLAVEYRWNGETMTWEPLFGLTENSVFPLGRKHESGFVASLCVRIASEYQADVTPEIAREAARWEHAVKWEYKGERQPVGSYF